VRIFNLPYSDLGRGLADEFSYITSDAPSLMNSEIDAHCNLLILAPPRGRRFVFVPDFHQVWWRDVRRWTKAFVRRSETLSLLQAFEGHLSPAFIMEIGMKLSSRHDRDIDMGGHRKLHEFLVPNSSRSVLECTGFLQSWFDEFGPLTTVYDGEYFDKGDFDESSSVSLLEGTPFFNCAQSINPEKALIELQELDHAGRISLLRNVFQGGGVPGFGTAGECEAENRSAWIRLFSMRLEIMKEALIPESYTWVQPQCCKNQWANQFVHEADIEECIGMSNFGAQASSVFFEVGLALERIHPVLGRPALHMSTRESY
jgi:hypothetical protein